MSGHDCEKRTSESVEQARACAGTAPDRSSSPRSVAARLRREGSRRADRASGRPSAPGAARPARGRPRGPRRGAPASSASRSSRGRRCEARRARDRGARGTCGAPTCAPAGTRGGVDAGQLARARRESRSALRWQRAVRAGQPRELRARERRHHLVAAVHRARAAATSSAPRAVERARRRRSDASSARGRPARSCGRAFASSASASSFVTKRPPSPAERFLLDCSEKPPARADGADGRARRTSRRAPAPRPRPARGRAASRASSSAVMSAAQPWMCTGMIARVRGVTAASAAAGSRQPGRDVDVDEDRDGARLHDGERRRHEAVGRDDRPRRPRRTPAAASATTQRARPAVREQAVLRPDERARTPARARATRARTGPRGCRGRARARPRAARRRSTIGQTRCASVERTGVPPKSAIGLTACARRAPSRASLRGAPASAVAAATVPALSVRVRAAPSRGAASPA